MNYQKIFSEVVDQLVKVDPVGNVASYIPELAKVNPDQFGVYLLTIDNNGYGYGDSQVKFSIQSISKVFCLVMAYNLEEEKLWERVGVEPSGTPFNSLVQLEADKGIPRNPFINAGALVICDVLLSHLKNPFEELISFVKSLSQNYSLKHSPRIAGSEKSMGFRNAALINLMKAFGNINNDIEKVLDFYYQLCSIEMTCQELARSFLFLAYGGIDPLTMQQIVNVSKSKRINAIMQTCGFYDEAGEFSFKVGLPGKSGVGGGIVAVHPGKYSIAVWSPRLNVRGNSYRGMKFLEYFTSETLSTIF